MNVHLSNVHERTQNHGDINQPMHRLMLQTLFTLPGIYLTDYMIFSTGDYCHFDLFKLLTSCIYTTFIIFFLG
jgi:hypothetical protein